MVRSANLQEELIVALAGALVALNSQFQLPCGRCWKMYKVAMRGRLPFEEAHRREVAAELVRFGWLFSAVAICPHCAKQQDDAGATK